MPKKTICITIYTSKFYLKIMGDTMETIIKKLITLALAWILDPANIKKVIEWVIDYIDKKAKENPDTDFWDVIDEIIDVVVETVHKRL